MKNFVRITLIVVVAVLLMGSSVQAQLTANQDVDVLAEILNTISIDEVVSNMDFSFGTSPTGGDAVITLGTDGSLTATTAGEVFWDDTGIPAVVNVSGTDDRAYQVQIETADITPDVPTSAGTPSASLSNGTDTLTVDRFLVEGTNTGGGGFKFLAGEDELTIGAVLTVPEGATIGDYTGDFTLTVSYE